MNESITNVPAAQVGRVVQDFVDDGATNVVVAMAEDGSYTVSTMEGFAKVPVEISSGT